MGFDDDVCNTGLGLGLISCHENPKKKKTVSSLTSHVLVPSLTLGPSEDKYQSCLSAVSSLSNSVAVKKEKELGNWEEAEVEAEAERVVCSRVSDEEEEGSPRKKLRLTKQQSAILEDSFKEHSNLNPKQKQALANQLNLRPRQVEVWFQNRRARTKLKQTEVDCELLKKCCETLTEENQRLQKELQELKSLKLKTPLYMKLPVASLTMCPSCEKVGGTTDGSSPKVFSIGPKPHLYSSFSTHQSAAC